MRTLADVRRRMTPGTEVKLVNHVRPQANGQRTVVKSLYRAICWRMPNGQESWLNWPTASELRIDEPNVVTFLERVDAQFCERHNSADFLVVATITFVEGGP